MNKTLTAPDASARFRAPRPRLTGVHALMLLGNFCWAANIVAAKYALRGFTPVAVVQLRALGSALLLGILLAFSRPRLGLKLVQRNWRSILILGLTGVTFNQLFFVMGVARTTVAHTGLLTTLGPVMVLALACLLGLESVTVTKFMGMLLSFAGVAMLSMSGAGQGSRAYWAGDLFLLAASGVFACYTILAKKVVHRCDAVSLTALMYGAGALLMLPFGARAVLATRWSAVTSPTAWALGYMVVFGSVVPYSIYMFAITDLAASRVAAFTYFQPVIATSLGVWLLSERLTWSILAGGGAILLGVYLTERERGESETQRLAAVPVSGETGGGG